MGTQALIQLADPAGGQSISFRVHYDGGTATGDDLRALIARDGYETVYRTIGAQRSRFWVSLNSSLYAMPDYVSSYPKTWTVELVAGYGLLFVGTEELDCSNDPSCFDENTWKSIVWTVSALGKVGGGFCRTI